MRPAYIVYVHEDISRRHIHIVSTCVNEKGEKIDDAYEWNRSMKACRELERKFGLKQVEDKRKELLEPYLKKADYQSGDVKKQVSNIVKSVFGTYRYQSFGEYSALLSCFNIEAKQVKGEFGEVPYNGIVYIMTDDTGKPVCTPIKSSLIGKRYGYEGLEKRIGYNAREYKAKKWQPKIRNEITLAMHGCRGNREEFVRLLADKGIDALFRENDEGRIYGATFIDHRTARSITAPDLARSSRRMPLNGSSIILTTSPMWMLTCRTSVCKADSPPIWKAPSNRLSVYSPWNRTVPTHRKRLLPEDCNVKRRRNAAHAEFPNYRFF